MAADGGMYVKNPGAPNTTGRSTYSQPRPEAPPPAKPYTFADRSRELMARPAPATEPADYGYASGGGGGYADPFGGAGLAGGSAGIGAGPASLGANPAYLAFLRALGAEESDLRASGASRIDLLNRELSRRLPEISFAGEEARRNIAGNMEARGLYRSGETEKGLSRQRYAEGQATSSLEGTTADQVAAVNSELQRRLSEIARQRAEQTLTSAGQSYLGAY